MIDYTFYLPDGDTLHITARDYREALGKAMKRGVGVDSRTDVIAELVKPR